MNKLPYILFSLFLGCLQKPENKEDIIKKNSKKIEITGVYLDSIATSEHRNAIKFGFKAWKKESNALNVSAFLKNDSPDTVYFINRSCSDGINYLLEYDTACYYIINNYACSWNKFVVSQLLPNEKQTYDYQFRILSNLKEFTLRLNFIEIDKSSIGAIDENPDILDYSTNKKYLMQ